MDAPEEERRHKNIRTSYGRYLKKRKSIPSVLDEMPETTMGDKSVETLGSKIRFLSVFVTFSPLPPKTMLIFELFFCEKIPLSRRVGYVMGG